MVLKKQLSFFPLMAFWNIFGLTLQQQQT